MTPKTRYDSLHLQLAGVDVVALRVAGTVPGIVVLIASARNGPGQGTLTINDGLLTWQSPGSETAGMGQDVTAAGIYVVEDGTDPSCYLIVQSYPAYLPEFAQAPIELQDTYNALGPQDVTAAQSASGYFFQTEYTLKNVSTNTIANVLLWLDDTASGFANLQVSSDGTHFYAPTSSTDPNVLSWASIAPGASVNLWVENSQIVAFTPIPSNAAILNVLQWQWTGIY